MPSRNPSKTASAAPRRQRHPAAGALLLALAASAPGAAISQPAVTDAATAPPLRLGLRVQADAGGIDGALSRDGRHHAGQWLRRGTLDLRWRIAPGWRAAWAWQLESGGTGAVDTAWLQWQPAGTPLSLRAGRLAPDFGLDNSISSSWGHLPERSPLWDLVPDIDETRRTLALRLDAAGPGWQTSAGAYRRPGHQALAGRAVWWPDDRTGQAAARQSAQPPGLHLGVSWALQRGEGQGRLRSRLGQRAAAELAAGQRVPLLPAWPDAARTGDDIALALEAGRQTGRWWLAAEALHRRMDAGADGVARQRQASGWTVTAAHTLHGAPRGWDAALGRTRGPGPAADGTMELVLRADRLLAQGADGASATARADLLSLGVNWFIDPQWRLSAAASRGRHSSAGALSGWVVRLQWVL
jgi:phosphate-selective porin OprO and OprP